MTLSGTEAGSENSIESDIWDVKFLWCKYNKADKFPLHSKHGGTVKSKLKLPLTILS